MKVSKAQAAENRARVVEAAGRAFRESGLDGIGIDGLMKQAGLTHGGFYNNFGSKEALAAEACASAMAEMDEHVSRLLGEAGPDAFRALLRHYLSPDHRDNPGTGCALAALATDAAHHPGPVQRVFSNGVRALASRVAQTLPGNSAKRRQEDALAVITSLTGALVLARAVDDPSLSDDILAASRRLLKERFETTDKTR